MRPRSFREAPENSLGLVFAMRAGFAQELTVARRLYLLSRLLDAHSCCLPLAMLAGAWSGVAAVLAGQTQRPGCPGAGSAS